MPNPKTTAAALTLEKDVAKAGRAWLILNGWHVHRINADKWKHGNNREHEAEETGTPDYLVIRPSGVSCTASFELWGFRWEAKRSKGGVIRKSQKDWRARHPIEMITYAKTFEELKAFVRAQFPFVKEVAH